ncbi:unnamed protein product, partial [Prorocentrum cordatum]
MPSPSERGHLAALPPSPAPREGGPPTGAGAPRAASAAAPAGWHAPLPGAMAAGAPRRDDLYGLLGGMDGTVHAAVLPPPEPMPGAAALPGRAMRGLGRSGPANLAPAYQASRWGREEGAPTAAALGPALLLQPPASLRPAVSPGTLASTPPASPGSLSSTPVHSSWSRRQGGLGGAPPGTPPSGAAPAARTAGALWEPVDIQGLASERTSPAGWRQGAAP